MVVWADTARVYPIVRYCGRWASVFASFAKVMYDIYSRSTARRTRFVQYIAHSSQYYDSIKNNVLDVSLRCRPIRLSIPQAQLTASP